MFGRRASGADLQRGAKCTIIPPPHGPELTASVEMITNLPPPAFALPDRSCGTCTLCCRLPEIDEFSKPANEWCTNCVADQGCTIYEKRPQLCRDFLCFWKTGERLGPEWHPSIANMMIYGQGQQITVLVDPAYPAAWKHEPYAAQLHEWAIEADKQGGYVIVFSGDDVVKINPARLPATTSTGL